MWEAIPICLNDMWWINLVAKIFYHCATFTKPNQSSEAHNTNQTFSTHETKYQTIPGAEIEQLFRNCFLPSCHIWGGGWRRAKRAREGRFSTTTGNSSESQRTLRRTHFLSQGTTVEHQDEAGEPAVRVRLLLQLPPHLRGQRDGEGQPERERLSHRWKVPIFFSSSGYLLRRDVWL